MLALPAAAQTASDASEQIVITASGTERRLFDTPYAVGVVGADELRSAGPMVNLSEVLSRVPGIVVNNRNNYAQDLQINTRGYGARTAFGVRGLRLYADGIPASGPDGQGQVTNFDLAGAQRIEVLRGPFSALYGNNSGGVISLVSAAPKERTFSVGLDAGSDGLQQWRLGVETPLDGGFSLRAQVSKFETDGLRPQSSAERTLGNVRLGYDDADDRVVLVLNAIDQPALDPLGVSRAQLTEFGYDFTTPQALTYNTRKTTRQDQVGASWRHRFSEAGALAESQIAAYMGQRSVTQWQSIPYTVQGEKHPGGVIDFDRDYRGVDARLTWRWALDADRSAQLVAGVSQDENDEDRRGFRNFTGTTDEDRVLGVTGELRRNERNRVTARDLYAQGEAEFAPGWTGTLGVRTGRVKFRSDDKFVEGTNLDDSGALSYSFTNPVAALQWRAASDLNLYVSAARGFESPTFNELAYKPATEAEPNPTGFNSDLKPQTSHQLELGAKWRPAALGLSLDAALFEARTDDEIGVAASSGGRTSFRNVGRTTRRGVELDLRWRFAEAWRAQLAATWLDATYSDSDLAPAGKRIAGTLKSLGYAELAWLPSRAFEVALEARGQSSLPVNDANTDFAAGYGLLGLRAVWRTEVGPGRLELLGRVDNLADRNVIGSVIVNEGNQRFFEPAPGRAYLVSARWTQPF